MSNRRVKAIDYDDDDLEYDDCEDEAERQEVSEDDKRQLEQATVEVRKGLDTSYQVSDAEIQDTLWNYYYDIAKTVTYIQSMEEGNSDQLPTVCG